MPSHAQGIKNYSEEWEVATNHINKGLPQSALSAVKEIYAKAKAGKQEAQIVKSLVYITQLQEQTQEDNLPLRIKEVEKEITTNELPVTNLLRSYLAGLYYEYFKNIRYKLYNRTNTIDFEKEDISTWSISDFHKKISELYLASLQNEKMLVQKKLTNFDAIINKGNVRNLRPTLYDLLAHTALEYFTNDEIEVTHPAQKFQIIQPEAFAPAATFAATTFRTNDSLSVKYTALQIYQNLTRLHINDAQPNALVDIDIQRIQYVHNNSILVNKEERCYQALQRITEKYGTAPVASQAWYLQAEWHRQRGNEYNANEDTTHRYELVKAQKILDKILQQKEQNEGWINAYNLSKELNRPQFSFEIEKVNLPDEPFRMRVAFKNINQIYLRIIPATEDLKKKTIQRRNESTFFKTLTAASPLKEWEQKLPHNTDLQQHATEIKMEALPKGEYFIVASYQKNFKDTSNILAAQLTYVSNISYISRNNDFFVLHRNTGQPLEGATIKTWQRTYDYNTYTHQDIQSGNYTTNANGYFQLANHSSTNKTLVNNPLSFEINYKNDKLFITDENYYYHDYLNKQQDKEYQTSIFLFTDRSLYRPGQTIYFKGVAIEQRQDGKKANVYSKLSTEVELFDANHQKINSLQLFTNEYGSFSGKFTLPENGLNGTFSIRTKQQNGYAGFHVEEYKRPKFYVDFEKVKGSYRANDSVKITGVAKAYTGNNIGGSNVKYRVVREARFPYSWLFGRGFFPSSESQEIANGTTTTKENGTFEITFKAIPDLSISEKLDPVFTYKIYADVTDINGETRSANSWVSAGYKSLLLNVSVPEKLPADSLSKISISTQNMSGNFEPASIHIDIRSLQLEQRMMRPRYWEPCDQYIMTKNEYLKHFPNDVYANEDLPESWQQGTSIYSQSVTTDSSGVVALRKQNFQAGYYAITISTKDKEGNEIKDVKYVELYNEKNPQPVRPQYLYATNPHLIELGQKTKIDISTSASEVFLIQNMVKENAQYTFYHLNKNGKSFDFTATENDRGGYGVSYLFVKNNRVFLSNHVIEVPWSNKELNIEYSTFRDKTLPGAEEKWTIKISGLKKEKIATEMLAGMYDASLDQFYPHQWQLPYLWHRYYNRLQLSYQNNFKNQSADVQNNMYQKLIPLEKKYETFLFGNTNLAFLQTKRAENILVHEDVANDTKISSVPAQEKVMVAYGANVENDKTKLEEVKDVSVENEKQTEATLVRTNFNETAFFFPDLKTDENGNISFSFTLPETLTKWKFQALAHTKNLALGYSQKEIVTQKDLMVQPNPPRFMREGDEMKFSGKVINPSNKEVRGVATLQLFDANTGQPVDPSFKNTTPQQTFSIVAGQSQSLQFPIMIPYAYNKALTWRMVVKTQDGSLSDGEENILPVLTNRMLVTETLPLHMRGSGTKNFKFDKLINSSKSNTLTTQSLTVEYTSNPVWYAVQALPYMMEHPYECAEQTWNRYYANIIASFIASSSPKIKQVFEKWKTEDTASLMSNLQKNQELKSILLEETPWMLAAKSEAQQKKNIALLFDLIRMSNEQGKAYEKLKQLQSSNGGFVWFKGGPDDRHITQYIITGIGHLKKLNASKGLQDANLNRIVQQAIPYLDHQIKKEYDELKKDNTLPQNHTPSHYAIQYLYMRSFFPQIKIANNAQKAVQFFTERSVATWAQQNKYMQAMIALMAHRNNDVNTPKAILKSLKESAIRNDEMGMYYKDAAEGWWWYEAPIERQALVVEALEEIDNDIQTADDLRTWLLKNKQTNNWKSTKATAEAVYALLLRGTDWLSAVPEVNIQLGSTKISTSENDIKEKAETGTGYFKKIISGNEVTPSMGNIQLTLTQPQSNKLPTWGGVYWQYFENLDKITTSATPLQLKKKLFVERNSNNGSVLQPIHNADKIKVGDKIKVRIELRVDRDMEYVHMKDMRAATFEPVNVLSQYKWQGGLGYYESTKDASTNFFFSYLRKGTYVFEYTLFAQLPGNFSNGISIIQCMYAPEFSSHSEGIRVRVE